MTVKELSADIEAIRNILGNKPAVKEIIIFGSYAYGEPDQDSDIDLCVIADLGNRRKLDVMREVRQELMPFVSAPLDILVYGEGEFEERSDLLPTLEYQIRTRGTKIYG